MKVKKGKYLLLIDDKPSQYSGLYNGALYKDEKLVMFICFSKKLTKEEMNKYIDNYSRKGKRYV